MKTFGEIIKELREEKGLPLRTVAAFLAIDQAILSKIERGKRKAKRELVLKMADYFKIGRNDLLIAWLSDNIVYQLEDEESALKVLRAAEEKVTYISFKKIDKKQLLQQIKNTIKKFPQIEKAWIYGSFARNEDGPKSDIDIALQTGEKFTYFDLAEVQHTLENTINRKVDVGFIDAFKTHIINSAKPDLKLIYER